MAAPALAIRRFALAVEGPPARAEAAARLAERAVRDFLPGALAERLPDAEGDNLLMLRRVELDLSLTEGDDPQRFAVRLAEAIAAAIGCALLPAAADPGGGTEGDAIPRFASPAARTAAFLTSLVEGRDRGAWWFRSFEGVQLLPLSAAARTVLLRDPAAIPAIFAALDPAIRSRFAASLAPADAGLLLDALAALPSPPAGEAGWAALAAALHECAARAPLPRALEALIALAASAGAPAIGGEVAAAARAAALVLADAPGRGRKRDRAEQRGAKAAALPKALRAALEAPARDRAPGSAAAPLFSPLGGYALLLPALLELDLAALTAGWPGPPGATPGPALQLMILAAAAGDRQLLDDPFWRLLLGLPPRLSVAALADWLAALPPPRRAGPFPPGSDRAVALPAGLGGRTARRAIAGLARRTLGRFAARLPGFASASATFLRANLLGAGATLREADGVLAVRLERPPLDVLLSVTGAAERELILPDGRPVRLERRQ